MCRIIISTFIFLLLTLPAHADDVQTFEVDLTVGIISVYTINNGAPLTFTFDEYVDFGVANDIGDINYDLTVNAGWLINGIILDGTQGGQTADDWDSINWTLTVNGVTIDEAGSTTIDSDGSPVFRDDALWPVTLNIPWSENAQTPDCTIELTAVSP